MSTAIAGQWRSCTASGVRCPWWSNVPAGDRERRPRNTRPTCRRPRMRCSSSWMPTTLEDPSLRQSGVNAIGSWASFWPCGRSWPTRHKWWWRFRWPQSRMTVNTWLWGQSVMNGSAFPWKPSRSTQRSTIRLWPFFLQTSSWMWRWLGVATPRSTGMLKWMLRLQDLSMPSLAAPLPPLKPWTWTPSVGTWIWQPRVRSSWGGTSL